MGTITRKPRIDNRRAPHPSEAEIQAVIHKGMAAPARHVENDQEAQVKLRLPASLLRRVDAAVKAQPIKTPRHRWLIEAIVEKLERESV